MLWPAAPALCRHLAASWGSLRTAAVLELGAGCGMVAILAAMLGTPPHRAPPAPLTSQGPCGPPLVIRRLWH